MIDQNYLLMGIFCIASIVHELGHVFCAKHFKIYEGVQILRISEMFEGKTISLSGFEKIPFGVCVRTNLEEEDIFQRCVLSFSGIFAGLWIIMLSYPFITSSYTLFVLIVGYLVACSLDFSNVFQITWLGGTKKKGFETKMVDVI